MTERPLNEVTSADADFSELIASLPPELQANIRSLQETLRPHLPQLKNFVIVSATAMVRIVEAAVVVIRAVGRAIEPFIGPLIQIGITNANCEKLEKAGWLPHYTAPLDFLDDKMPSVGEIDSAFREHYVANWPTVRNAFETRLARYQVDAEAKKTFEDALCLHELGMYKAVCRLVFPEIERLARVLRQDGSRRDTNVHGLRKTAGQLTLSQIEPSGLYGLVLFRTLDGRVYEWADGKRELKHNGVPNRHDVMHSFSSLSSLQLSVNALIITDYVFQIIHAQATSPIVGDLAPTRWMADNFKFPVKALAPNESY